jgi:hypothetical protein
VVGLLEDSNQKGHRMKRAVLIHRIKYRKKEMECGKYQIYYYMMDSKGEDGGLVGKPEVNTSLGRRRHRREDNIKIYLQETGCRSIHL